MKDVEYAYAVAYIKTLENKMLTRADIEGVINAQDTESAMRLLRERGWEGDTPEQLLKNELERSWSAAYEVCPEEAPIDILMYENDFHNLKTVLKAQVAGADQHGMTLSPSLVEPEQLALAVRDGDFSELPEFIRGAAEEGYRLLTTTMDGQLAEIYIDKCEHTAVLERARSEKDEFLIGWAELLAELANMKIAWRASAVGKSREFIENALVPTASAERMLRAAVEGNVPEVIAARFSDADVSSVGAFERWCDNKKLAYAKKAKAQSFGFQPILAFLVGKSFEIQAVRIILSCKANGVEEQIIRERLRDMYV